VIVMETVQRTGPATGVGSLSGMTPISRHVVASVAEIESAERLVVDVEGISVLVGLEEGRLWAIENRCPHHDIPLLDAPLTSTGVLICPWHRARFDVDTGESLDLWCRDPLGMEVGVDGGSVWVSPRPLDVPGRTRARFRQAVAAGHRYEIARGVRRLLLQGDSPISIFTLSRLELDDRDPPGAVYPEVDRVVEGLLGLLPPTRHELVVFQAASLLARHGMGDPWWTEEDDVPAPAGDEGASRSGATATGTDLAVLEDCWDDDAPEALDRAAATVSAFLAEGGDPAEVRAALGSGLVTEDAGPGWYAAYGRLLAAAGGAEEAAHLVGFAAWMAAHTPTRRFGLRTLEITSTSPWP
jgi:nitrite reductase/ring-hydroxylating ferredoxin subunit